MRRAVAPLLFRPTRRAMPPRWPRHSWAWPARRRARGHRHGSLPRRDGPSRPARRSRPRRRARPAPTRQGRQAPGRPRSRLYRRPAAQSDRRPRPRPPPRRARAPRARRRPDRTRRAPGRHPGRTRSAAWRACGRAAARHRRPWRPRRTCREALAAARRPRRRAAPGSRREPGLPHRRAGATRRHSLRIPPPSRAFRGRAAPPKIPPACTGSVPRVVVFRGRRLPGALETPQLNGRPRPPACR